MSDFLQTYELYSMPGFLVLHYPQACSNSYPLSLWCHPTMSSSVIPFFSCLLSFPASGTFPMSTPTLPIRWPKCWSFSFSISPSNEYLGLTSFRMDWLVVLAVQESSPTPQFKNINSLALSIPYGPIPTSITWLLDKPEFWLDGLLLAK